MAARAIWKGRIRFGEVDVPVKLYSAVQDRGVHFRLLHDKDLEPVRQQMVNPETGKVVEHGDVRRAFQTEAGDLVMLDADELAELEPEASREIEVTRFLDPDVITHQWYDRPYFLGPDDSDEDYFALVEALRRQGKEGVARWVMRKKEYVGALRVNGDHLMLMTLRHAGEVVPASALKAPGGRALDRREINMAKQLVSALEDELDMSQFGDEYRERVLELVEAKAEGKVLKFPEVERREEAGSLADMLAQSVSAMKKTKRGARG
jgi:DNA end-binding protein Ku